ncbi:MAG: hypothetical protein ABJB47_07555 [Actinomycetota bacterium]
MTAAQFPSVSRRGLIRAARSIGSSADEPLATDSWVSHPPPAVQRTGG